MLHKSIRATIKFVDEKEKFVKPVRTLSLYLLELSIRDFPFHDGKSRLQYYFLDIDILKK